MRILKCSPPLCVSLFSLFIALNKPIHREIATTCFRQSTKDLEMFILEMYNFITLMGEQAGVEVGYLPSTPGTRVQIPGRASE